MDPLETAAKLLGYASARRYQVRGESLFNGIPLAGKRVLDIGSGRGAWAIWAGLDGASQVLGIEPEAHGSTAHCLERFKENIAILGLAGRVVASDKELDELLAHDRSFDVVVMFNVINHLDEEAVKVLHRDRGAKQRYVTLLASLRQRMQPGGWLIVADCARTNFWNQWGTGSPFAREIEWDKHQDPEVWIEMFRRAGFCKFDLHWSPLQPFPKITANSLVQYLTCSHFVLRCRSGASGPAKDSSL